MTRLAVISDTHLPSETVPEWVKTQIRKSDHTIHAGDLETSKMLDELEQLVDSRFTAVRGNWDPPSLDLSPIETIDIDGVRFVVTHGTNGQGNTYEKRVIDTAKRYTDRPENTVCICGHTHKVLDTTIDDIRVLNPGSASGMYPAKSQTMQIVTVKGGSVAVRTLQDGATER